MTAAPEAGAAAGGAVRDGVRLHKRLAELGLASRRGAERLMAEGRIRVNGAVVREPGFKVAEGDLIELEDAPPAGPPGYLLNKPVGTVCTKGTKEGPALPDLLPPEAAGLPYAGRLDKDSRGLVLLLRDGRLNQALTDPAGHFEKEYRVTATVEPSPGQLGKMARGLALSDGPTRPCRVEPAGGRRFRVWLSQGRNRQIRRMAAKVGLEVEDLLREAIGPLRLGDLAEGAWRALSDEEEEALRRAVGAAAGGRGLPARGPRGPHA